jgi:hypothetical protein
VFNRTRWPRTKVEQVIWQGFLDYGRGDWAQTVALIKKDPDTSEKALARFDAAWGNFETICHREGMSVKWVTIVLVGIG